MDAKGNVTRSKGCYEVYKKSKDKEYGRIEWKLETQSELVGRKG